MRSLVGSVAVLALSALAFSAPIPRLVHSHGRYALLVDDAPYLILGAQINNSSAWPEMLPKVWPAIAEMSANTVEAPVYWEQVEQRPGEFDFSLVDTLLAQARQHQVRLILLWFGTWKNGSQHYMPGWMKREPATFSHVTNKEGRAVDSPSPFAQASREADKRAFGAFMAHLRMVDEARTVIAVQVENETGTWGSLRDYSPQAEKIFAGPVPDAVLAALHLSRHGSWREVFGDDADEYFHAWAIACYVNEIATAGKAAYPLPLSVNAALRDPLGAKRGSYESGGPTDNVLEIWKACAPSIDVIGPDIYLPDVTRYRKVLDLYNRPDNALYVPETGSNARYAPYFFEALRRGAIGWAPFGIDFTAQNGATPGGPRLTPELLEPFSLNYRLLAPISRTVAKLSFERKLQAVLETKDQPVDRLEFLSWIATVSYGLPSFGFGSPKDNPALDGRAFIAQLGPDDFLLGGFLCRIDFAPREAGRQRQFLKVEEVTAADDVITVARVWNGDQTDYGLNLGSTPVLLRVTLSTY